MDDKLKGRENTKSAADRRGKRLAFFTIKERNDGDDYYDIAVHSRWKKEPRIKIIPSFLSSFFIQE